MNAQAIRRKVENQGDSASLPQNLFDLGRDAPIANSQKQAAGDDHRDEMKGWHHQGSSGLSGMSGAKDFVRIPGELGPFGSASDVKGISGGAGALPAGTSDWQSILGEGGNASAVNSAADRAEEWKSILMTPPNISLPLLGGLQGLGGSTLPGIDAQATATNTDTRMSSALNSMLAPTQAPEFKSSAAVNPLPSTVDVQPQAAPNL